MISLSDYPQENEHASNGRIGKIKSMKTVRQQFQLQDNVQSAKQSSMQELKLLQDELMELRAQKNQLLKETQEQIEKERADWETEKAEWIDQAKQAGFQEGLNLGKQAGAKEYEALIQQMNDIVASARNDYHDTIDHAEEDILEIGIQIAGKIMKRTINEDRTTFLPLVRAAIQEVKNQPAISIYLHPDDYEYVLAQKDELMRMLDQHATLSIGIDDSLSAGSCVIEHPYGKIDASIDTQLESIRIQLQEVLNGDE